MKTIISTIIAIACTMAASANVPETSIHPTVTTPILARDCEEGKTIMLELTLNPDGTVDNVFAINPDMYDLALAARVERSVAEWKFDPPQDSNGKSVSKTIQLPVTITDVRNT